MEVKHNHPLEGQFIIYDYHAQDYERESWALALYQLRESNMMAVHHPEDYATQPSEIGREQDEQLLRLMERENIMRVYSVRHLDDFFGIPFGSVTLDEIITEEGEEIEYWCEWKPLRKDSEQHLRLRERGIEVVFYEEPQGSISPQSS